MVRKRSTKKTADSSAKKQPRSAADLAATAHHEAGHAVILVVLGIPVTEVSIVDRGDAHGTCGHPSPYNMYASPRDIRRAARDCILVSYAGVPAQRLVDPNPHDRHGDDDDVSAYRVSREYQVFPRVMQYDGDDYHLAFLERLRRESARLVRRHAAAIRHLAKVLLDRKMMTGDEVEAALAAFDLSR